VEIPPRAHEIPLLEGIPPRLGTMLLYCYYKLFSIY